MTSFGRAGKMGLMKKLSLYIFLVLMVCNIARAESTLSKCEGSKWYWTNCFGTTDYKEGNKNGIYEGEWKGAIRHGQGTYDDNAGSIYIGEWKFDERSGEGIQIYSDGSKYEGQWIDDQRSGEGIQIYSDGSEYEGQWIDDITTKQYNKHRLIITIKNINYELLIPILLVVAITVLIKLFANNFYLKITNPIKRIIVSISKDIFNNMKIKKILDFKGRASRLEYWSTHLIVVLFSISLFTFTITFFQINIIIIGAIFAIPIISVTIRRMHDVGISSFMLIPFLLAILLLMLLQIEVKMVSRIVFIIYFVFISQKSQEGINEYGPNPKMKEK